MAKMKFANDPMGTYETTQEKHWQAIYLYQTMTASEVAEVTGYAPTTVRNYYNKYRAELPVAVIFFEKGHSTVPVRRQTVKHNERRIFFGDTEINWLNETENKDTNSGEKAYLFRFYEKNNPEPVFSKIGTTAKSCLGRLKDEIRYYNKAGFSINKVEICEIWDCGEMPAESYESFMRALLIKRFPNTWKKNDRFFGVTIPTEIFVNLCQQYAELGS